MVSTMMRSPEPMNGGDGGELHLHLRRLLLLREVWHAVLGYWCKAVLRAEGLRCVASESCACELRLQLLLRW